MSVHPSVWSFRSAAPASAPARRARRAFTLVELIVVIAIVAIVVGFTLVALRSARQGSRVARCLAQVRSLQLAHLAYAADHRGFLADVGLPHGGIGFPEQSFITTLRPYFDSPAVLRSPLDESPHWPSGQGGQGVPVPGTSSAARVTSYGMNDYLSRSFSVAADFGSPIADRLARIPSPAATVMSVFMAEEGAYAGSDHPHVYQWAPPGPPGVPGGPGSALPPIQAASQLQTDAAGGKAKTWDARSNYGFADGHVGTLPFSEVYQTAEINRFDPAVAGSFGARMGG
ncbi:MAG TPA: prepilin-type N-terminal cleavage/methylation domain-containing protein [Phycisphaerales bacterium]|nr:prepilin-type N-terminal cleavage/methylation domain-containing protein [Phycisphaerales bacterium]HMP37410.1 prepilin-type N-terminal cleavage/methylation domain-containing protein [Phycisphaerales bacterium]